MVELNNSLTVEYDKMEKRYENIILEGRELKKELNSGIRDYVDCKIVDHEWVGYLKETASYLAMGSVKMKIAKGRLEQIKAKIESS